jgi:ribosomal protein S18 acetylase RimI-like enzyme
VGFAALLDGGVAEDGTPEAQITALFTRHEEPGQALVDACVAHVSGARRLLAFPASHRRCPIPAYNAGWDGLSDRLRVVARVLARSGFRPFYRELHLECSGAHFPPPVAPAPTDVAIVERNNASGDLIFAAMAGDEEVGVCVYRTLAHLSDHPEARQWGYVMGLHVAEALRRRGVARHLLTRALRHLADHGCRGCWLTTGADNWPAQPLYLALGFEIVDASACFRKEMTDPPAP